MRKNNTTFSVAGLVLVAVLLIGMIFTLFVLNDENNSGISEVYARHGMPSGLPVVGDWDGDGQESIGVFRPSLGEMCLRNALDAGLPDLAFAYGLNGDLPLAGHWGETGTSALAPETAPVFQPNR